MKKTVLLILLLSLTTHLLGGHIFFNHLGKSNGLSQISVVSICQDELGRMWFGTLEGLNCYDGNGMTVYKPSLITEYPFFGNEVHNLVSGQGHVFFTSDHHLIRFDVHKETFHDLHHRAKCLYADGQHVWAAVADSIFQWNESLQEFSLTYCLGTGYTVTSLSTGKKGFLWIGTHTGLYRMEGESRQLVSILPGVHIHSLYLDSKERLWVAAYRKGMYRIAPDGVCGWEVEEFFPLSNHDVRCFEEDGEGGIWIATFNGLYRIDPEGAMTCYRKEETPGGLKHSSIFSLYRDKQATIWVGTYYGGVHYVHPEANPFRHYAEQTKEGEGLSFPYVGQMVEDKRGAVWICTEGGGLNCWDRKEDRFTHYLTGREGNTTYTNLKCMAYDPDRDCLYIGTHKQGFLSFDIATKRVTSYPETQGNGDSFTEVLLHGDSLLLLSSRGVWVKARNGTEAPHPLRRGLNEMIGSGSCMWVDQGERLWIAGRERICRMELKGDTAIHVYRLGERGLGRFMVVRMAESADGTLYLGTCGSGLYRYIPADDRFEQCLLPDADYIYAMCFHHSGYLILMTDCGVMCWHPETGDVKLLDAEEQLHLSAVNDGCGLLVCSDDAVLAGGAEGMTAFAFASLLQPTPQHNLYFASLSINGRRVTARSDARILPVALSFAKELRLAHDENNLSITVASNNYVGHSNQARYEYKLEGFDRKWNTTQGHTIVYTNLDPGHYRLKVRELTLSRHDEVKQIELSLVVRAPWWATWWAYLLYAGLLMGIVGFLIRNWMARVALHSSLERERMEKEKNEELIQAKIQFFANISHEFRTPLTLIISQLESLLQSAGLTPFVRSRLQRIYRSTFQLRELITELLDFRKMERGKLTLHVRQAEMVEFLNQICEEFQSQAQLQHIHLTFHSTLATQECWFDSRQLRKVVTNLLSNALKFTPAHGKVELLLNDAGDRIEIKVADSGEGIPQESIPLIFDRFYQVKAESSSPGSGIGLALAKGIVELHHGTIDVKSAVGYGSVFTVSLPKENPFLQDENAVWDETQPAMTEGLPADHPIEGMDEGASAPDISAEEGTDGGTAGEDRDCILLVEDNEELLQIVTDLLSPRYRVIIAMDGKAGYDKVVDEAPDLVVSDVMMPVMTGMELCKKVKNNFDLCHIPVILLTAMTSDNSKIEGMQCGADDYIEKPFNNKLLLSRIANLLRNRKLLKRKYGTATPDSATKESEVPALALTPMDARFLSQLDEVVKAHLSQPDFDVNQLAHELCLSRSSLYNKLKALSLVTPNEYILNTRLKVAAELLKQKPEMQITEIAYQVGFNSLRYFRHCFKASFNRTPQEYRQGV